MCVPVTLFFIVFFFFLAFLPLSFYTGTWPKLLPNGQCLGPPWRVTRIVLKGEFTKQLKTPDIKLKFKQLLL
jgi:hypothetical protein